MRNGKPNKTGRRLSKIYLTYDGMITPLGKTPEANFQAMREGKKGVQPVEASGFNEENWPLAKINWLPEDDRYNALLTAACEALSPEVKALAAEKDTLIILSTTKSDVNALPGDVFASSRKIIAEKLHPANRIIILSNACISGVLAVNTGADYIQSGQYKHVIVIGIDALSNFVTYGFQSLFALSAEPSQPFDKDRKGISLGEAAGVIVISNSPIASHYNVEYLGGSSSNDANHISGPSRTGEGLYRSVNKTIERANVALTDIDFISAHGTGTLYNDEMESIALDRLGLNNTPVNSLKGFFGHTLGAAGVIEIISTILMMEHNTLVQSVGFKEQGTSKDIHVITGNLEKETNIALKTASGFGGGNASVLIKKLS